MLHCVRNGEQLLERADDPGWCYLDNHGLLLLTLRDTATAPRETTRMLGGFLYARLR
jgi:hypothetical protein